jgi:hypothetical protein
MVPERCSLKPPNSKEWVAHLDRSRVGTYQVVIALTETKFIVWEKSHMRAIGQDTKGFHALSKDELFELEGHSKKMVLEANPGDILIMQGGICVHSSPGVGSDEPERICTYAHWDVA